MHGNKQQLSEAVLVGCNGVLPWKILQKSIENCIFHPYKIILVNSLHLKNNMKSEVTSDYSMDLTIL